MTPEERYMKSLRGIQARIAQHMGLNLASSDKQTRVIIQSSLMLNAFLLRMLVEKNVFTNEEFFHRMNFVHDPTFELDHVSVEIDTWDMTPTTGV